MPKDRLIALLRVEIFRTYYIHLFKIFTSLFKRQTNVPRLSYRPSLKEKRCKEGKENLQSNRKI